MGYLSILRPQHKSTLIPGVGKNSTSFSFVCNPHSGYEAPAEEVETNRGIAVPLVQQESNAGLQATGALLSSNVTMMDRINKILTLCCQNWSIH